MRQSLMDVESPFLNGVEQFNFASRSKSFISNASLVALHVPGCVHEFLVEGFGDDAFGGVEK